MGCVKEKYCIKFVGRIDALIKISTLSAILFMCSIFHTSPLEGVESEPAELILQLNPPDELVSLSPGFFIQHLPTSQVMELPSPIFEQRPLKSSFLTVGLSGLMPGLGHFYLGDMNTAGSLVGIVGLGIGGASFETSREISFVTLQNTWFYGMYAAYRDVRTYNGQAGYSYQMPINSFTDLTSAPFSWSVLKKPEVWGGLLGKFVLASLVAYVAFPQEAQGHSSRFVKEGLQSLATLPIGVGEESFFRGFLQSQLSEMFNPWVGIAISSLVFGVLHIPNARNLDPENRRGYYTYAVPMITLGGVYYGWLTNKNHSLREGVALHTWYDFILGAIGSLAGRAAINGDLSFAIALPF